MFKKFKSVFKACCLITPITFGCGQIQEAVPGLGGEKDSTQGSSNVATSTSLGFVGSLNLTGAALRLTEDTSTFDIYCVTFDKKAPAACASTVDASGAFNQKCEKFANISFGCFLRQQETTVGQIQFIVDKDQKTSLAFGGGDLSLKITWDGEIAKAVVDTTSSALSNKTTAAATTLNSMTGNWKLSCQDDGLGFTCPPDMAGASVYFVDFPVGEKRKVSIWESKERHDQCVGAEGDEASFSVGFNGISLDLTNLDSINASVENVLKSLSAEEKEKIISLAVQSSEQETQHCELQGGKQDFNPFRANNCKLVSVAQINSCWYQPENPNANEKGEVCFKQPDWSISEKSLADLTAFSGSAQAIESQCVLGFVEGDTTTAPCPGYVYDQNKDKKDQVVNFTQYVDGENALMLACTDTFQDRLILQPAPKPTLSEAVASFGKGSSFNNECNKSKFAGGEYRNASIKHIKRAVIDLMSFDKNQCRQPVEIGNNFNFSVCDNMNENTPEICFDLQWIKESFRLKVASGKLAANGSPDFYPWDLAPAFCSDIHTQFETAMKTVANDSSRMAQEKSYAQQCQSAFASLSSKDQALALLSIRQRHMSAAEVILCQSPESDPVRSSLSQKLSSSCMVQLTQDQICDERGNCSESIRCPGSPANGKCVVDGVIVGRVSGRHAVMDLQAGIEGAFDLSEVAVDQWSRFDQESNKPIECKMTHQTIIAGVMDGDNKFNATFNSKDSGENCGGQESSSQDQSTQDSEKPSQGGEQSQQEQSRSQIFKFIFERQ